MELCPTCNAPVIVDGGPTTWHYTPALAHDKSFVKALLRIKELEENLEIMVKTLEFYANRKYITMRSATSSSSLRPITWPIEEDYGEHAKKALKEIK